MEVLQHHYLVSTIQQHPATLFGVPIVNHHHPITVDYGQPCIFFPRSHPLQWFPHYGPMVAVHVINVAPSAAGDSFMLPPLAASLMLQPVNHPAFYVVPLSSLWVTIPAFFDYRPQVLGPSPPVRVLGPPPPVSGTPPPVSGSPPPFSGSPLPFSGSPPPVSAPLPPVSAPLPPVSAPPPPVSGSPPPVLGSPAPVLGQPGGDGCDPDQNPPIPHQNAPVRRRRDSPTQRTVYIKFVAGEAPITDEELDSFFRQRLVNSNLLFF
uniref:pollen-specific leucine-rich repeat extensin-like protein 3 n=1 Tax=Fragaria vesca subsp. vesca TaxID=101020 RepID=UPI0005C8FB80|nr:PREDICTED: pollen-specific leucine-rich repeat extensin-like protein 3 [Fragaria vesca subsp. vesca]